MPASTSNISRARASLCFVAALALSAGCGGTGSPADAMGGDVRHTESGGGDTAFDAHMMDTGPGVDGATDSSRDASSGGFPWSGIIDPSRATDWSGAGVPGGIPNRTMVCATFDSSATADQISAAIAACPSGQVVSLRAGTFNLASGISFDGTSGVTLRGAGADQTKLIFTGSIDCRGMTASICMDNGDTNWVGGPSNMADWTSGYAPGTTQITLSSTTNLMVGNALILDQVDDSSDTGGIFVCATTTCTGEGGNGSRDGRSQSQMVRVTAISGNRVTFTPGLRMPNWRASQNPGAWWANTNIKGSGVENLSIDNTDSGALSGIYLFNALGCWVRGVRSINPDRNHVWLLIAAENEIRDSYFYGGQGSASQSYGIEWYPGSDNLVENDMFQHVTAPMVQNAAMSGDVVAYNFAIDDNYTADGSAPGWMLPMFTHHNGGDGMILLEGNDGLGLQSDNIHGTHHFATLFRNDFYGDTYNDPPKNSNTEVMHFWAYSRFFNVIGNVLGRAGYYDTYENDLTSTGTEIFSFGEPDPRTGSSGDPVVKTTLMRWGNYDTVNAAVRWEASEVPSGASLYPNAVPASETLPASFFRSAPPPYWTTPSGTPSWPANGPDVSGGNITGWGGHANKIPARVCYENSPDDPAYGSADVRTFAASTCYP